MQEFEVPKIGQGEALLRVEMCGICGSDVKALHGDTNKLMGVPFPVIPGHEPVGIIEEIGAEASRRWDVKRGDRVAVETLFRCGFCRNCLLGSYVLCTGPRPGFAYGIVPTAVAPGIWGGFAEMLLLNENSTVHKVPSHVPADLAVLYQPLGGGVRWTSHVPNTKKGDTVLILGPGPRGLAGVIAAREAGAGLIIVSGIAADATRLAMAKALGADVTIDADVQDVIEVVTEATSGAMADVAVDMSALATKPVTDALRSVREGGTVVLAGTKNRRAIPDFVSDELIHRQITMIGVRAVDYRAYAEAIEIIASGKYPLEQMRSHTFSLDDAERAIRVLGREVDDPNDAITIALRISD
jgi:threonine dehydrogenase-like Zn-dependent dehydrogenase